MGDLGDFRRPGPFPSTVYGKNMLATGTEVGKNGGAGGGTGAWWLLGVCAFGRDHDQRQDGWMFLRGKSNQFLSEQRDTLHLGTHIAITGTHGRGIT